MKQKIIHSIKKIVTELINYLLSIIYFLNCIDNPIRTKGNLTFLLYLLEIVFLYLESKRLEFSL